ncbi:MAG: hypothetical protein PVH31_06525 [Ectothiorhodospiraceae bacterium]|jgi:hypothetical protein
MQEITGGCHCGNVRYRLVWPESGAVPVRECKCSFCRKHGGRYTAHPRASLGILVADRALLSVYRFGSATADFLVCRTCGVVCAAVSAIDGRRYGVVRVDTFDPDDVEIAAAKPVDFDGESREDRLQRRTRTWIPDVSLQLRE